MSTEITHLDETTTSLVNELIDINNQLEPLNARKTEIEKYLRGLGYGKYTTGVFDITISPSRRFDKKAFEKDYPAETNGMFYTPGAPQLNQKMLSPALKEQYQVEYDPRITIK